MWNWNGFNHSLHYDTQWHYTPRISLYAIYYMMYLNKLFANTRVVKYIYTVRFNVDKRHNSSYEQYLEY